MATIQTIADAEKQFYSYETYRHQNEAIMTVCKQIQVFIAMGTNKIAIMGTVDVTEHYLYCTNCQFYLTVMLHLSQAVVLERP